MVQLKVQNTSMENLQSNSTEHELYRTRSGVRITACLQMMYFGLAVGIIPVVGLVKTFDTNDLFETTITNSWHDWLIWGSYTFVSISAVIQLWLYILVLKSIKTETPWSRCLKLTEFSQHAITFTIFWDLILCFHFIPLFCFWLLSTINRVVLLCLVNNYRKLLTRDIEVPEYFNENNGFEDNNLNFPADTLFATSVV